jgi:hypothetical protein
MATVGVAKLISLTTKRPPDIPIPLKMWASMVFVKLPPVHQSFLSLAWPGGVVNSALCDAYLNRCSNPWGGITIKLKVVVHGFSLELSNWLRH